MKILTFGSLNIDHVYKVDHILAAGETLSAAAINDYPGGKGLNQTIAIARAGSEVYLAGTLGLGGESLKDLCLENGIYTDYLRYDPQVQNGHTVIQIDKNGQNCILVWGGSNRKQTREAIDNTLAHFSSGDWIILQNEINDLPYIIDQSYAKGLQVILNPSPYDELLEDCDFNKVSLFLVNEIEGGLMTGEEDLKRLPEALLVSYPKAAFVLTLGSQGAIYIDQEQRIEQESFSVPVVDTTGAGDTFTGYFISARAKGKSLTQSMSLASKAAAISVTRSGAVTSIPVWEEVNQFKFL